MTGIASSTSPRWRSSGRSTAAGRWTATICPAGDGYAGDAGCGDDRHATQGAGGAIRSHRGAAGVAMRAAVRGHETMMPQVLPLARWFPLGSLAWRPIAQVLGQ
jgi:hypothetical protein